MLLFDQKKHVCSQRLIGWRAEEDSSQYIISFNSTAYTFATHNLLHKMIH